MALALNNLQRVDMPLNKETKPNQTFHLRDYTDRVYVSRKDGGRELVTIEYCLDVTVQGLEENTKKSQEKLISAASNSNVNII